MTSDKYHWDPSPAERSWYTHRDTGDRGWLVRRDGRDCIRLDRGPHIDQTQRFGPTWVPDTGHRPLNLSQAARVAYAAYQELMRAQGAHGPSQRDWLALSDLERAAWLQGESPADATPEAASLHSSMWAFLSRLAR